LARGATRLAAWAIDGAACAWSDGATTRNTLDEDGPDSWTAPSLLASLSRKAFKGSASSLWALALTIALLADLLAALLAALGGTAWVSGSALANVVPAQQEASAATQQRWAM
jgi:hypothetical protein